jgi:hypothetical protein
MAEGPVAVLSEHPGGDSGPTGRPRGSCSFQPHPPQHDPFMMTGSSEIQRTNISNATHPKRSMLLALAVHCFPILQATLRHPSGLAPSSGLAPFARWPKKANKLDKLQDIRLRQRGDLHACCRRPRRQRRCAERAQLKTVAVGLVPVRWTGPGIAGLSEIVDGLTKSICKAFRPVPFVQPSPMWRDVESGPVMEYAGRRIRIVANKKQAARRLGDAGPREWR